MLRCTFSISVNRLSLDLELPYILQLIESWRRMTWKNETFVTPSKQVSFFPRDRISISIKMALALARRRDICHENELSN